MLSANGCNSLAIAGHNRFIPDEMKKTSLIWLVSCSVILLLGMHQGNLWAVELITYRIPRCCMALPDVFRVPLDYEKKPCICVSRLLF